MTSASTSVRQEEGLLLALLLGLVAATTIVLAMIGEPARRYLALFLWTGNRGATVCSLSVVVGAVTLLTLLHRKRTRAITIELQDSLEAIRAVRISKLGRWSVVAPHIVGSLFLSGVFAVLWAKGVTSWHWLDVSRAREWDGARGSLTILNGLGPYVVFVPLWLSFVNTSGLGRLWRSRVVPRLGLADLSLATLPIPRAAAHITAPEFVLGARESRASVKFESEAKIPSWVTYGMPEIQGGMCIFGMKGSGKTQLVLRLVEQAVKFRSGDADYKPSLCIIDVKGDLVEFVTRCADTVGRSQDVFRLGVGTPCHWNPLGSLSSTSRAHECRQVGYFLRSAMSNPQSGGESNYWNDNADNLCFRAVHLLALAGENVSFASLYKLITHLDEKDPEAKDFRTRLYEEAERKTLLFDAQRNELEDTKHYFEKEFVRLDNRVRTIVINVASNFLQKFITLEYKRAFGGDASDDNHFYGFKELIARGGIFVLDIRSNEHGTIANQLATLTKLFYMAAVKTRDLNSADKGLRKTMLVADEYQGYVTPSSAQTEGDDKYFETSRSFGAIDIIATQQLSSIVACVGESMTQRIIGNFNTLVVFKHNDPRLTRHIADVIGSEEVPQESVSIQEGASSAGRSPFRDGENTETDHSVSRSVTFSRRERPLIDANIFKQLDQFEAIGVIDGFGPRRIVRFFTKPVFCDLTTPHNRVIEIIKEGIAK